MNDLLFVYGTLRPGASADLLCTHPQQVRWFCRAHVHGLLYQVSYYPGLILLPATDGRAMRVMGDVFQLKDPLSLLRELDQFEACTPEDPQPHEYRREEITVTMADGSTCLAWVYVYNHDVKTCALIASGDFLLNEIRS